MECTRTGGGTLLGCVLLLLSAACGDGPTAPPFVVTVEGPESSRAAVVESWEATRYECNSVPVDLIASGGATGASATWAGASLRLTGSKSGALLHTSTFGAAELAEWLGSASIASGQTQSMVWWAWGTEPFRADLEYRYRVGGRGSTQVASFSFRCY